MKILFLLCFSCLSAITFAQIPQGLTVQQHRNCLDCSLSRKSTMPNNKASFKYVYRNGIPYGKSAFVIYDDFYKKYKVSFTKEDGFQTGCTLTYYSFIYKNCWTFTYNGNVYRLSNAR